MRLGVIYTLSDPDTGLVRYVGQTICKPSKRFDQHKYQWKRSGKKPNKLNSWIKHLASKSLLPIMEIIKESIPENLLDREEIDFVRLFKSAGAKLVNGTNGGGGLRGFKQSEEARIKRLESLKVSEVWKERNTRHSVIMKERFKEGRLGIGLYKLSEEDKKKASEKMSLNHRQRRVIKLINNLTQEVINLDSMKEMMDMFGCHRGIIRDFLNGGKTHEKLQDYSVLNNYSPWEENKVGEKSKPKKK